MRCRSFACPLPRPSWLALACPGSRGPRVASRAPRVGAVPYTSCLRTIKYYSRATLRYKVNRPTDYSRLRTTPCNRVLQPYNCTTTVLLEAGHLEASHVQSLHGSCQEYVFLQLVKALISLCHQDLVCFSLQI